MLKKAVWTNISGILFSRIFGLIRDLGIANVLGASLYSDIFFIAFKFPNLFRRIVGEGAFMQSFIPVISNSKDIYLFSATIFKRFLFFIAVLTTLVNMFPENFTKIMGYGLADEDVTLASKYVAINFYYLIFIFFVAFFGAMLQFKKHFAVTSYSTSLLNISIILALITSYEKEKIDVVYAISLAVVSGGVLQALTHVYMMQKKHILNRFFVALFSKKKESREIRIKKDLISFKSKFLSSVVANSTAQVVAFLDTFLATFLASGSVSYLYYGNRIFQLPLALFAIATATAIFPSVSKALKDGANNSDKAHEIFKNSFLFLLGALSVSMLFGIYYSEEIMTLLFKRGSFTLEDVKMSAGVLDMYLIGLLPYGLSKLFTLLLMSQNREKIAAKISFISLILNTIFAISLLNIMGVFGLAFAGSLAGFSLLFLNVHYYGKEKFISLFKSRYTIYIPALLFVEFLILILFKDYVDKFLGI